MKAVALAFAFWLMAGTCWADIDNLNLDYLQDHINLSETINLAGGYGDEQIVLRFKYDKGQRIFGSITFLADWEYPPGDRRSVWYKLRRTFTGR